MKKHLIASAILAGLAFTHAALAGPEDPANVSGAGHWDIGAVEHEGDLELEIGQHVGQTHIHHPLGGSIINYNFLGEKSAVTVGSTNLGSVWVTPETEVEADNLGMPFVGFSAEELDAPFTGPVTFTMTGFSYTGNGTGNFYLFEGTDLFWNSTAGAGSYGSFSVDVGQHGHGEFAFSDPGTYSITLTASANNGSLITSAPAAFTFEVVPEPSTYALLALGALAAAAWRFRRKA
jgi:surface-anchored protein